MSKLDTHIIKTVSCGDEFSIVIDDGGMSWVWGRDDLGQVQEGSGLLYIMSFLVFPF